MEKEDFNPNEIQIELTDKTAEGTYANLTVIAHSPSEFVLDFVQIAPGVPKAKVKSRIIMTPDNAQRLLIALQDNLKKYQQEQEGTNAASLNAFYKGPQGKA